MATYARVNEYGFIETPYRKVVDARVTGEVSYYSALDEENHVIAQANTLMDEKGNMTSELISCRKNGEFVTSHRKEVDFDGRVSQSIGVRCCLAHSFFGT